MSVNVSALIQERQNKFIELRTITESEVNKFFNSLKDLDPDVQKRIKYNPELNAQAVLPSLWTEPFVEETYLAELGRLKTYISQVKAVGDEINAEALRCLQS